LYFFRKFVGKIEVPLKLEIFSKICRENWSSFKIGNFVFFRKSVGKIEVPLKSDFFFEKSVGKIEVPLKLEIFSKICQENWSSFKIGNFVFFSKIYRENWSSFKIGNFVIFFRKSVGKIEATLKWKIFAFFRKNLSGKLNFL